MKVFFEQYFDFSIMGEHFWEVFEAFLQNLVAKRNQSRAKRFAAERTALHPLPATPLAPCKELRVSVSRFRPYPKTRTLAKMLKPHRRRLRTPESGSCEPPSPVSAAAHFLPNKSSWLTTCRMFT